MNRRAWLRGAGLAGIAALGLAAALYTRVRHEVRDAIAEPVRDVRPLEYLAVRLPGRELPSWGGPEITGVSVGADGWRLAGGFGVTEVAASDDTSPRAEVLGGLPSRAVSALTAWRGRSVVALQSGGIFLLDEGAWHELRSGWGTLEVRALDESSAGELLIGARQGLFRIPFGARQVERLGRAPVRAFAAGAGFVLAGGEDGLVSLDPAGSHVVEVGDPWIESVALLATASGHRTEAWVVTATGLVRGPVAGPLVAVPGGERVISGVGYRDRFVGVEQVEPERQRVDGTIRWFEADGRSRSERLERAPRRLFASGEALLADTAEGPWWTTPGATWRPAPVPRFAALPAGSAHVTALALADGRLIAGVFDGGLIEKRAAPTEDEWRPISGARAWGVNALLSSGGATYVASLRGAARLVGNELQSIEGPGAAFSLAATDEGVVIGYGQGVALPDGGLLSAFHGLPGNQALALMPTHGGTLLVGTPSGLGAIRDRKVRWRMATGDEKLPHPWVTALVVHDGVLLVGTYGGGIARRPVTDLTGAADSASVPALERFVETEGWKVNPGALVVWQGRCYAGTDGNGLFRLARDGARFDAVPAALPSRRVTALTPTPEALYIGTDQGIAVLTPELE